MREILPGKTKKKVNKLHAPRWLSAILVAGIPVFCTPIGQNAAAADFVIQNARAFLSWDKMYFYARCA